MLERTATAEVRAIETRYQSYRMRSRTEARWGVFFDALGIVWEYEKEGYHLPEGDYLPDFWLPEERLWVEIKGQLPTDHERDLCRSLLDVTSVCVFLVSGLPGERPGEYFCGRADEMLVYNFTSPSLGVFPQFTPEQVNTAIKHAKSARFEHGESGAVFPNVRLLANVNAAIEEKVFEIQASTKQLADLQTELEGLYRVKERALSGGDNA